MYHLVEQNKFQVEPVMKFVKRTTDISVSMLLISIDINWNAVIAVSTIN